MYGYGLLQRAALMAPPYDPCRGVRETLIYRHCRTGATLLHELTDQAGVHANATVTLSFAYRSILASLRSVCVQAHLAAPWCICAQVQTRPLADIYTTTTMHFNSVNGVQASMQM